MTHTSPQLTWKLETIVPPPCTCGRGTDVAACLDCRRQQSQPRLVASWTVSHPAPVAKAA
jgi:hypothetical protein